MAKTKDALTKREREVFELMRAGNVAPFRGIYRRKRAVFVVAVNEGPRCADCGGPVYAPDDDADEYQCSPCGIYPARVREAEYVITPLAVLLRPMDLSDCQDANGKELAS